MDRYTLLYLKWVINKVLLFNTWKSAQCYVAEWMGGEFGEEWITLSYSNVLVYCLSEKVFISASPLRIILLDLEFYLFLMF